MNETRPYFYAVAVVLVVLIMGIVGQCQYKEKLRGAEELPKLTREQRTEIISRQYSALQYSELEWEEYLSLADRIMSARVEREWRESR